MIKGNLELDLKLALVRRGLGHAKMLGWSLVLICLGDQAIFISNGRVRGSIFLLTVDQIIPYFLYSIGTFHVEHQTWENDHAHAEILNQTEKFLIVLQK